MALDNPTGERLTVFAWTLFGVAAAVVALRIWTRVWYLKSRLAWHDWLMILAFFSEVVHCCLLQAAADYGLGMQADSIPADDIAGVKHYARASEAPSVTTSYFGRMSFAIFLLSVITRTQKNVKKVLYGIITVDTVINVVVLIQIYTQCGVHLNALWNSAEAEVAHCLSSRVETDLGFVQASMNSACDLLLTILPVAILWSIKLPDSTKLGLGALLTLSSFALVASIAKAVEIQQLASDADFPYQFAILQFCVVAENDVVMIAASVPMLRALWIKNKRTAGSSDQYADPRGGSSARKSMTPNLRTAGNGNNVAFVSSARMPQEDEMYMLDDVRPNKPGIFLSRETAITVQEKDDPYTLPDDHRGLKL